MSASPHNHRPSPKGHWWLLTFAAFLAAMTLLTFGAAELFARAGGGGSYGGGGGSSGGGSGGGGGGGGGELIFWLIQLCIHRPLIGLPLTAIIIGGFVWGGMASRSGYISHTIRRGRRMQDEQRKDSALFDIQQRDPAFDVDAFLERVSGAFLTIQEAWSRQDMSSARAFISDGIYERFALQFEMQKFEGFRNVMEDVDVQSAIAVAVHSDNQFDTIHVEFRASATDYNARLENNKKIRGSDATGEFTEYWSFHRRPGAKTLTGPGAIEGNCPNCAAPLKIVDKAQCPACQSTVNSGEHDWVLAEITQAMEWHVPSANSQSPGLQAIKQLDPGFSVQHIEDRVSVMFWRLRAAEFFGDIKYARPVLSEQRADEERKKVERPDKTSRFWKDAAVGKVEIADAEIAIGHETHKKGMDSVRVVVRWSGIRAERGEGNKVRELRDKTIITQVYVLTRKHGVQSRQENAFSSSGCSQCGAPVAVSTDADCPFCGATLTDGRYDWVLNDIERYTPELAFRQEQSPFGGPVSNGATLPSNEVPSWELSLAVMAHMMFVDGHFDDKEKRQLVKLGRRRGLSDGQIRAVMNTAANGEVELPLPRDLEQGRKYLEQLVQASLADGNVCAAERRFLTTYAEGFGLSAADVKLVISKERRNEFLAAKQLQRERRKQERDHRSAP